MQGLSQGTPQLLINRTPSLVQHVKPVTAGSIATSRGFQTTPMMSQQSSIQNTLRLSDLKKQISKIAPVSASQAQECADEILSGVLNDKKTVAYPTFQSGKWNTCTLFNASGNSKDSIVSEGEGQLTEVMDKLPKTKKLLLDTLNHYNLKPMFIRVALLEPNARLWEHTDYVELNGPEKLRLHLPLQTNAQATMNFNGCSVQMGLGHLWKLDPRGPHAVQNMGSEPRVHLLIDCYKNDGLNDIVQKESLKNSDLDIKPVFTQNDEQTLFNQLKPLHMRGEYQAIEHKVLGLFHEKDLQDQTTYDVLSRFYEAHGDSARSEHWQAQKVEKLLART